MKVTVNDRTSYNITKRTYTDEGFLVVPGRVARTGIQQYLASELGLTDRQPNEIINVYRPSDEVFNVDSLASYESCDVTLNHPTELVNAANYKSTTVGVVRGPAIRDGDFVEANLIIKSKDAISAVESGKVQLSAGYTAIYDKVDGTTELGEKYEFIQRDIKINHIAICDRARAGAQARLYDNEGVTPMFKIMLDSGAAIEVADEASAKLVTDALKAAAQRVTDAEAKMEEAKAKADMKEEELEAEKAKTTDAAIAERVEAISTVRAQAVKMVGDTFTCDSVDAVAIQRAALTAKRPTIDWATKSDVYVQASFDMALSEPSPVNQLTQFAKDAATLVTVADAKPSGYQTFKDKQSNAWKGE